jgi:hypothetical protein
MKLNITRKQIIIGSAVLICIIIVIVIAVVLTRPKNKKQTKLEKPSAAKTTAAKTTAAKTMPPPIIITQPPITQPPPINTQPPPIITQPPIIITQPPIIITQPPITTLIPSRPTANMITVGFIDANKSGCIESHKTKSLPIKNIVLNSYPLVEQALASNRPYMVLKLGTKELRGYFKAILVDSEDFSKSIYLLSFGNLTPSFKLAYGFSPKSTNISDGIKQIRGNISVKSISKDDFKIEQNFISVCSNNNEDSLFETTIEYNVDILEAINNDLQ